MDIQLSLDELEVDDAESDEDSSCKLGQVIGKYTVRSALQCYKLSCTI